MRYSLLITTAVAMFSLSAGAFAARDSHAMTTQAAPQTIVDPLDAYVRTTYPTDVKNVRSAVTWLLEDTNWAIQQVAGYAPADANAILAQSIDPIAQLPRTMSRLDAIQILIGANNAIVLDRNHRLITFTAAEAGARK